jgi:lipopolysaccharide export system protein LptA
MLLTVLTLAAVPAGAASLTITASRMRSDAATGVVVAEGEVQISDGTTVAVGRRLVLDTRRRTAVLTAAKVRGPHGVLEALEITLRFTPTRVTHVAARGKATLELRRGVLSADEIGISLEEERLTATGHVQVFTPPDVLATGSHLTYNRRTGRVALAGPVRVQTGQGVVTGQRLEGAEGLQEARLWGDVRVIVQDITARADAATLIAPAQKVILTGAVRITQRGQTLEGSRVTIFYGARRVIAEGPTRLRFEERP